MSRQARVVIASGDPGMRPRLAAIVAALPGDASLRGFSTAAMRALSQYHWPGNVRELQNVIEQAGLLPKAGEIEVSALPRSLRCPSDRPPAKPHGLMAPVRIERRAILAALGRAKWRKEEAAMALGVRQATLEANMKYSIDDPYRRRRRAAGKRGDASHLAA